MKFLLCDLENNNNEELKNHLIHFHLIYGVNYFLNECFTKNTENKCSRRCEECKKKTKKKTNKLEAAAKNIVFCCIINNLADQIFQKEVS